MNLIDVIQVAAGGIGGSLVTLTPKILDYLRGTKRDEQQAKKEADKSASEIAIQMWLQLSKEQSDWRDVMRKECAELRGKLHDVQMENAQLRGKLAELEAKNADLVDDNTRLEKRVKELEKDLVAQRHQATPGLMPV